MLRPLAAFVLTMAAMPAAANEFTPVRDQGAFLSAIAGKEMRLGLFGVSLQVLPDGRIDGSAQGWDVTGTWTWQDGHFCREMDWGGTPIPYNCQLVELRGDSQIRFTVDRGAGRAATLNLR